MDRRTPHTPEDFLFRGFAYATAYKEALALDDLDMAIKQRDSPIARAFRGFALNDLAGEGGKLPLSQRAQDDMRRAKILLPDNLFVRATNLSVNLTAAILYGEADRATERLAALNEAKSDVEVLQSSFVIPRSVLDRVRYYEDVGDERTAIETLRLAADQETTRQLLSRYALALYRQGKIGAALAALEALDQRTEQDDVTSEFIRVRLLAEQPEHGQNKAYRSFLDVMNRHQNELGAPFIYRNSVGTLLFLGMQGEAAMSQLDDLPSYVGSDSFDNMHPTANYVAEKLSEEEFLESAGSRRSRLCGSHYWIGLVRLSKGDRQGAREHFEKSVATSTNPYVSYYLYSRIYLERLKQDPTWPPWIPVKE